MFVSNKQLLIYPEYCLSQCGLAACKHCTTWHNCGAFMGSYHPFAQLHVPTLPVVPTLHANESIYCMQALRLFCVSLSVCVHMRTPLCVCLCCVVYHHPARPSPPQLSALVLSKLLSSLPVMRRHLRAGYLLGDTRSDKTGSLTMNNKVGNV